VASSFTASRAALNAIRFGAQGNAAAAVANRVRKRRDFSSRASIIQTLAMDLDREACYRAIKARDRRFDGRFLTRVLSTGIFCRPICPARTPTFENAHQSPRSFHPF